MLRVRVISRIIIDDRSLQACELRLLAVTREMRIQAFLS